MMLIYNASDGNSSKCKTKIVGKPPERSPRPDTNQAGNQPLRPPVLSLNFGVFHSNILAIFRDFLIYH